MFTISKKAVKASKKEAYTLIQNLHEGKALTTGETESLLLYFAPPMPKKAKTAMEWLAKAAAVQDVREYLCYVYVTAEGIGYATDGHIACRSKLDGMPEGYYCPKTLAKVTDMAVKYPNVERVFTTYEEPQYTVECSAIETVVAWSKDNITAYEHGDSYVNKALLDRARNGENGQLNMYAIASGAGVISHRWVGTTEFGDYIVMGLRP